MGVSTQTDCALVLVTDPLVTPTEEAPMTAEPHGEQRGTSSPLREKVV
jgi:hypothetical protein